MSETRQTDRKPGECIPWEEKRKELPQIQGNEDTFKEVWGNIDSMAYVYIWHVLVSF